MENPSEDSMGSNEEEIVYPVHIPGETVMAPVTWDEWQALRDVAEAADEFWVGANDVMTASHHDDIGDSYESLRAALVRLEEVRRD